MNPEFLNQSPREQMMERMGLEPHIMGLECCYGKKSGGGNKGGGGTNKKLKSITPGMSMKEKAKVRHHNFKVTGVQTHGGTKKNYSKAEARKIGAAVSADNAAGGTASFASVTRGAKDPRNRAQTNQNVKVGDLVQPVKDFNTFLGTNYSQFAGPSINYNYSQRPKSDISFSDAVRAGARFNEAGRNDLGGGTKVAMDNLGGPAAVIGGLGTMTIMGANAIKNLYQNTVPKFKEKLEKRYDTGEETSYLSDGTLLASHDKPLFKSVPARLDQPASKEYIDGMLQRNILPGTLRNPLGIPLASTAPISTLGIQTPAGGSEVGFDRDSFNRALEGNYDPDSAGGLNIGGNFGLSAAESDRLGRVFQQTPSPRMLSEGGDLRMSDMFEADTQGAKISKGINAVKNRIPILNMLPDMKINTVAEEAQRRYLGYNPNLPASALARMNKKGGGTRLPMTPTVAQEVAPQYQPVPSASTTPTTQTGVDPNRLLQIQQQAYAQAYNPMLIGGFNPQFRFGAATPTIDYSTYFNY